MLRVHKEEKNDITSLHSTHLRLQLDIDNHHSSLLELKCAPQRWGTSPNTSQADIYETRRLAANFTSKLVVDFRSAALILPIISVFRAPVHQFEHYPSLRTFARQPGRLRRRAFQNSCIKHRVCEADFHSCFPTRRTPCMQEENNQRGLSTSPLLLRWNTS